MMGVFSPNDSLSDNETGSDDETGSKTSGKKERKPITSTRVVLWVLVGGYGVYLVVSGLIDINS